jgi:hypothetical protein
MKLSTTDLAEALLTLRCSWLDIAREAGVQRAHAEAPHEAQRSTTTV